MAIKEEATVSELAEAITAAVLRAAAAQEDFRRQLGGENVALYWEPIIRWGGRLLVAKGAQIPGLLNQQIGSER